MGKAGIAATVLIAVGAVGIAGAWYTGTQLEPVLQESIRQGNAQLSELVPDDKLRIELVGFERGIFSSQVRYRLTLPGKSADAWAQEMFVSDRIEHGPLPLSRLVWLKLLPVMAVSHAELENTAFTAALFEASAGLVPIRVSSSIGYGRGITGKLTIAPLNFTNGETSMTLSGLDANFRTDTRGRKFIFRGTTDSFAVAGQQGDMSSLNVRGLTIGINRELDDSGLYLGAGRASVDELTFSAGQQPVVLSELVQTDRTTMETDGVTGTLAYDIGGISYAGQPLGSMHMGWNLSRLQPEAVAGLTALYNTLTLGIEPDDPEVAEAEFKAALQTLLEGKPHLALEDFSIRTANGESRFSLGLDLDKPQSLDLPLSQLIYQMVADLNARLVLSRPMLSDMVRYKALADPGAEAAAVEQEAIMVAEVAGNLVEMMQLGRLDGEDIIAELHYADGMIDLNGQHIALEDFIDMLQMMAPGGNLGMSGQ